MSSKLLQSLVVALVLTFNVATVATAALAPAPQDQTQAADSLYKRLGGYDALAAVTDDFLTRLATDPKLGRFFVGFSTDSQIRIRQHVVDFLCVATGGPCKYAGRDMETAHTGLHITEEDWTLSVKHLGETLDKLKSSRPRATGCGERHRTAEKQDRREINKSASVLWIRVVRPSTWHQAARTGSGPDAGRDQG
jgi:hemoglobin